MRYAILDLNNNVIPFGGAHFARWAQRHPDPRIMRVNYVFDWVVTTVFVGHDDDGNWPPHFWWVGACHPRYPNVTCRFETEEGALRCHEFLIRHLSRGESDGIEFHQKAE